jgi:glycosyltransferase involved in cell wall biosynthesis
VDDNFSFPSVQNDRRVWQAQEKYFTYMMANSTVVTAVSPVIAEKYSEKYQRSVEVLRNGVDVPHFAAAANSLPPEDLLAVDRPVLLFIGAINSWIDIKLLDQVAQSLPESLLILVGPCFNDSVDQATWQRLTSRTNVRWLGSKPYQQLPQYAGVAKVLLLPRTNDEHSRASDPLKLYEYLATGQAVVSTPLPSALQYSDYVYVAETPEEFVQQIKLALVEHTTDQAARQREFAQQFAWPHKIKQMSQLLEQSANVTL